MREQQPALTIPPQRAYPVGGHEVRVVLGAGESTARRGMLPVPVFRLRGLPGLGRQARLRRCPVASLARQVCRTVAWQVPRTPTSPGGERWAAPAESGPVPGIHQAMSRPVLLDAGFEGPAQGPACPSWCCPLTILVDLDRMASGCYYAGKSAGSRNKDER
jgi:hypothetical protein